MRSLQYWSRHKVKLAISIIFVLAVAATQSDWLNSGIKTAEEIQPGLYKISQFVDGDTIVVDMNGHAETVRFIGVDTPETHDPRKPVQCFGQAAADHTKAIIGDSRIRLQTDPLDTNRDRYDRLLRYVYLPDGTNVNARIIQDGYGFAYRLFPFEKTNEFTAYEKQAREAGIGLWKSCQPTLNGKTYQSSPIQ